MIQKTVAYLEPQFQKIEDADTGISYWRIELELGRRNAGRPFWLVVEAPELHDALKDFANQLGTLPFNASARPWNSPTTGSKNAYRRGNEDCASRSKQKPTGLEEALVCCAPEASTFLEPFLGPVSLTYVFYA